MLIISVCYVNALVFSYSTVLLFCRLVRLFDVQVTVHLDKFL